MAPSPESTYKVEFNHHVYTLPVCQGAGGSSLIKVDFIHNPYLMHDAAVEANRLHEPQYQQSYRYHRNAPNAAALRWQHSWPL